jgi:hypothetical protein
MKVQYIKLYILLFFLFLGCSESNRITQPESTTATVKYTAGEIYSDTQNNVEFRYGNTPFIIVVPHDGSTEPTTIPDRNGNIDRATNTRKAAEQLAYFLNGFSGGKFPHLIVNNLHRSKMDPDLDLTGGAQGNAYATQAYNTFHKFVQTAVDSIEKHYDSAVLINLIGHDHDIQRIELGFLLSGDQLNLSDSELNSLSSSSSIAQISSYSSNAFSDIIRGVTSIGNKLKDTSYTSDYVTYSFDVVPNESTPSPGDNPYNSGGYIVERYGSHNGGKINSIEISSPFEGHRDSANSYRALGYIILESIKLFYEANSGDSLY